MNLLIISENFLDGGLETQIDATYKTLKEKINFFFAIKNYKEKWNLKNVYTNFHFSGSNTINQFCEDVDKLIEIILKNNIDVIHVHPFFSFFPAVFAAKICKKPIVYTYHGLGSYNFTYQLNDTLLFNILLNYEIDKIFCVSLDGKKILENITQEKNKIIFLPNSINIENFSNAQISNNKSWALVSRLDDDKINEITKLINILNDIDINELHIFGDGYKKEFLEHFISENNLTNKVFLEGHSDILYEKLSNNFNGMIGIGRVAMEAISMEFPTILIGYNKIAGIIDSNMYNFIKNKNFTNIYLPDISIDTLKNQIEQVYNNNYDKTFYKSFREEFSSTMLSDIYFKEISNINNNSILNLKDLYDEIKLINNNDLFYDNFTIYNLLKKYFSRFVRLPHQKDLFIIGDYYNKVNAELTNIHSLFNKKFNEYENKINSLSEHTMTYNNLKRKLKYKFNKK